MNVSIAELDSRPALQSETAASIAQTGIEEFEATIDPGGAPEPVLFRIIREHPGNNALLWEVIGCLSLEYHVESMDAALASPNITEDDIRLGEIAANALDAWYDTEFARRNMQRPSYSVDTLAITA